MLLRLKRLGLLEECGLNFARGGEDVGGGGTKGGAKPSSMAIDSPIGPSHGSAGLVIGAE